MIKEICSIAEVATVRLVVTYSGDGKYAAGFGDGVTEAIVANGTPEEIELALKAQLPTYREKIAKEAAERKVKEDAVKREAALKAAEAKLNQENAARKTADKKVSADNQQNQTEFDFN